MVLAEVLFAVHLKHSSFRPSPDAKPMSKDLVHAVPWQRMYALYVYYDIYAY
jgi:hypothetical protein